jgi:beta-phosphoglucomutase-like phosphatase (HAD superfamily)
MNCQAILFDLDGTLIDSTLRIQRLWVDWGSRHGIAAQSILEVMQGYLKTRVRANARTLVFRRLLGKLRKVS